MNEQETEQLISMSLLTPTSEPPTLDALRQRLQSRRQQRRRTRITVGVSVSIAATLMFLLIRPVPPEQGGNPAIASVVPSQPTPTADAIDKLPAFEVFARVRQPRPVFHRLEGSELLQHVGWVESEEVVPLNLSLFPEEQRESFYQVLDEGDPALLIQL